MNVSIYDQEEKYQKCMKKIKLTQAKLQLHICQRKIKKHIARRKRKMLINSSPDWFENINKLKLLGNT